MSLFDLLFLASVLLVLFLIGRMAVQAGRGRWSGMRQTAVFLGFYLAFYATALVITSLTAKRRVYAPGERKCFDDWCVAGISAEVANRSEAARCSKDDGGRIWIATLEVSSDAKRVRQRALDAAADLEDQKGHRYKACAEALTAGGGPRRLLSDELGPGESFRVLLPFRLPIEGQPAGLIVSHGAFPGIVIIGDAQSFLHPRSLWRVSVQPQ